MRARLEATTDLAARRAALERTRASVRGPAPPLDDISRHRLVRNAVAAGPGAVASPARSRRWIAVTATAAAGLLVVAGIGVAISSMSGDSSNHSSGSAASSAKAPLRGDVGDLGDVTSAPALRALLDRRAAGAKGGTTTSAPSADSELSTSGETPVARAPAVAPSAATTAACARQLAGGRAVAFTGTGTYQRTPVTIVGINTGGRTIVFVVSDTDCTNVLASISR